MFAFTRFVVAAIFACVLIVGFAPCDISATADAGPLCRAVGVVRQVVTNRASARQSRGALGTHLFPRARESRRAAACAQSPAPNSTGSQSSAGQVAVAPTPDKISRSQTCRTWYANGRWWRSCQ